MNVYYKDGKEWKLLDNQTVIMKDDVTKVEISKKDITNNNELPGAKLEIKDKDGNTIHEWTSSDKPHYIEKLPAGDYTLVETTAPNGYLKAEDVPFTVLPTGDIQHVQMFDKPDDYGILIHKVDKETKQAIKVSRSRLSTLTLARFRRSKKMARLTIASTGRTMQVTSGLVCQKATTTIRKSR